MVDFKRTKKARLITVYYSSDQHAHQSYFSYPKVITSTCFIKIYRLSLTASFRLVHLQPKYLKRIASRPQSNALEKLNVLFDVV
jgi:hypothetical protein